MTDKKTPAPAREPRALDRHQRRSVERGAKMVEASRASYQIKVDPVAQTVAPISDDPDYIFSFAGTLGSSSDDFLSTALGELATFTRKGNGSLNAKDINAGLAFIDGGAPQNEVESALLLQMYATHNVAMRCMRTMADQGSIAATESFGALAVKLLRTFTAQAEALSKLQRGGEQIVRHIHVDNRGGQAVIAENVHTGGGRIGKGAEQSLAPEMLGANPAGHTLPVAAGHGSEKVPHARRDKPRRARRQHQRAEARAANGEGD